MTEKKYLPKLEEGAWVKVKHDAPVGEQPNFKKGEVGQIIRVDYDERKKFPIPYYVKFDNHRKTWMYAPELDEKRCGKHKTERLESKEKGIFCPFCNHD